GDFLAGRHRSRGCRGAPHGPGGSTADLAAARPNRHGHAQTGSLGGRTAMTASPRRHATRPGFSLMEVLVALAIFLLAFAGISRLVTFASDRALDVKLQSQATQLCQAKLAEAVAGAVPLSSQADVPLDEDPSWTWSLDAEQGSVPGLWNV